MARPTPSRFAIEQQTKRQVAIVTTTGHVLCKIIPWAGLVGIAYFMFRSVDSLAGKETFADIAIKWFGSVKANQWAAWIFASLSGIGWYSERRLRRKKTEQMAQHISDLEKTIDPKRSSTTLTTTGLESSEL